MHDDTNQREGGATSSRRAGAKRSRRSHALVIGIFWKRFGTPTSDSNSGTEHELRLALAAWQQQQHPQVMVYFCERAYAPDTQDELEQWSRVIGFREELDALALTARYVGVQSVAGQASSGTGSPREWAPSTSMR